MTYGHAPAQEPLPRGSWNFGKTFFGHHYYVLNLFAWSLIGRREEDFLRNTSILHFLPPNYLPVGWGSWNCKFYVSLPYRCYIPKLVKIGLVVFWDEDVNGQPTTNYDGCQPIVIGHLSHLGDLKIQKARIMLIRRVLFRSRDSLFSFSFPEPLGQFLPYLAQSILE